MAAEPPAPGVHTLGVPGGLQVQVSELGATWLSCRVPLADGSTREVLVGAPDGQPPPDDGTFRGAIVGRVANRIAHARYGLDGRTVQLPANEGPHQLHGGADGFHRRLWQVRQGRPDRLQLSLTSPDGDQGHPGDLTVQLVYRIDGPRTLTLAWRLRCSAPCPVNLSAHPYFNLDADPVDLRGHRLRLAARAVLPVDAEGIPTGQQLPVAGTPFDLRRPMPALGPRGRGYDHCFVLDAACVDARAPAAVLESADRRLRLCLHTTLPGLQVYTGAALAGRAGRNGLPCAAHAGVALEPQYFPDSPNRPAWQMPGLVLRPGDEVEHRIEYHFAAA